MSKFDFTGFDFSAVANFESVTQQPTVTSDKFADRAKRFMTEARIDLRTVKSKTFVVVGNAIRDISLPLPGQQLRIRTQTQFSMLAFILKIVYEHEFIDELTIATYTLNRESFKAITDLVRSGKITRLNLLIASSYSYRDADYKQELINTITEMGGAGLNVHLVFVWTHFKITLARCGLNYYLIEGSMNYSMNNMAEQVLFENNEESYNFDYRFITDTMTSGDNQATEIVC